MSRPNGAALYVGIVLFLLGALAVGLTVGAMGTQAALLIPGIVGGLAVLVQPLLGLTLLVFVIPFENMTVDLVAGMGTATRFLGMLVAGAWLMRKLVRREPWDHLARSGLLAVVAVFVMFAMASNLWALIPFPVVSELFRLAMFVSLTVLAIDLVQDWRDARAIVIALVLGGLIAAVMVVQQYLGLGVRRAGAGIAGGISSTAFILVTLVPLGFYLLRAAGPRGRLVGLAYLGVGLPAIVLTFSRISLLVLPLILLIEYLYSFRSGHGRLALLAGGGVALVAALWFVPTDPLMERVETIGPYVEQTFHGGTADSPVTSERGFHIRIGLAIFTDHPFIGAGWESYRRLFVEEYQFHVPGSDRIYRSPRSPHGSFWGLLANLGLAGFFLWILVLGVALRALFSARRNLLEAPARSANGRLLVHALTVAFLIQVIYMAVQDVNVQKVFWLILGLTVVVHRLSEHDAERESAPVEVGDAVPVHGRSSQDHGTTSAVGHALDGEAPGRLERSRT